MTTISGWLCFGVDPLETTTNDALKLFSPPAATHIARDGARREILDAVDAVLTRSGSDTFTPAEMARRGTSYAESTIRTMITAHLSRNAHGQRRDNLERTDRGRYRLTST